MLAAALIVAAALVWFFVGADRPGAPAFVRGAGPGRPPPGGTAVGPPGVACGLRLTTPQKAKTDRPGPHQRDRERLRCGNRSIGAGGAAHGCGERSKRAAEDVDGGRDVGEAETERLRKAQSAGRDHAG